MSVSTTSPADVVRVKLAMDNTSTSGCIWVDFDMRLQFKGSDMAVYANQGARQRTRNLATGCHPILRCVVKNLFHNRSGVSHVNVETFRLLIFFASTNETSEIMDLVVRGVEEAGYKANRLSDGR